MHGFFVPPELLKITNIDIALPKELAHQIRDVIRLDIGEQLLLLDNSGDEILATVPKTTKLVSKFTCSSDDPVEANLPYVLFSARDCSNPHASNGFSKKAPN